jgi:EAL domain-containing protein (putative c-di-GMP-specific phosphodiesterase class I)
VAQGSSTQAPAALADLERAFERAIVAMRMAFQPIVRPDNTLFGYEALLRPNDPELPHPGALIEAAERLNRLPRLGRSIRARVAEAFAGATGDHGLVFVNLHALDLIDPALASPYSPLVGFARRVVLEITERASLQGMADVRDRVVDLRQMGYRIAIDDLGAGHARMKEFQPTDTDFVKLDLSVVRDCDSSRMKQTFIASIISLCKDNGIQVIGECVETEAEARCLVGLGCDLLQGYFYAKPGPPFPTPAQRLVM